MNAADPQKLNNLQILQSYATSSPGPFVTLGWRGTGPFRLRPNLTTSHADEVGCYTVKFSVELLKSVKCMQFKRQQFSDYQSNIIGKSICL